MTLLRLQLLLLALGLSRRGQQARAGELCWDDAFTHEACCQPAPSGNASCWDGVHTYEACCTEEGPPLPSRDSGEGYMPQAGGHCWDAAFTREVCCGPGPGGDARCWDDVHTYEACCVQEPLLPASGSREDRAQRALASPYAALQAHKLQRRPDRIHRLDAAVEVYLFARFAPLASELRGAAVLCVGARLGGEVRAFTRHGALAVGVDFNPGARNLHVLPGDAHNLQFADGVFQHVYCNILDHITDIPAFVREAHRVLRPWGRLWLDVSQEAPGTYEVNDLRGQLPALLQITAPLGFLQVEEAKSAGKHLQVVLLKRGSSQQLPGSCEGCGEPPF